MWLTTGFKFLTRSKMGYPFFGPVFEVFSTKMNYFLPIFEAHGGRPADGTRGYYHMVHKPPSSKTQNVEGEVSFFEKKISFPQKVVRDTMKKSCNFWGTPFFYSQIVLFTPYAP